MKRFSRSRFHLHGLVISPSRSYSCILLLFLTVVFFLFFFAGRGCHTAFRTPASLPGTVFVECESKQFSSEDGAALGHRRCSRENVWRCEWASEWIWLMRFVGLAWRPTSRLVSCSWILTPSTTTTTMTTTTMMTATLSVLQPATLCAFSRGTVLRWTAASRFPSVRAENHLPGNIEYHLKKLSWVFLSYMHSSERVLVKKEQDTALFWESNLTNVLLSIQWYLSLWLFI